MNGVSTLFALSSGPAPAAIAVVRLSGPLAGPTLARLTGKKLPEARRAVTRKLLDTRSAIELDQAMVLWLPGPDTVTGEDMVELHLHGGRAVVQAVLDALGVIEGLKPAEAGAFTRQAFDNGRLDLSQVEGLADLLSAETESQRRNALALSEGLLGARAAFWRSEILILAAQTEALLDFADEDDVDPDLDEARLGVLIEDLEKWASSPSVERLRDGVRVVIAGPPNAGKSTLLNALAGRPVAITAPIAGTTRDLVEAPVAIAGVPFIVTDTAGLHDKGTDVIEAEGMRRAHDAITTADIILWLGDARHCPDAGRAILVVARADEVPERPLLREEQLFLSAKTGLGMADLRSMLLARAAEVLPTGDVIAINRRQRGMVVMVLSELEMARSTGDMLVRAEHFRLACNALDRLVGKTGVEEMLDALFGSMCIGK